LRKEITTAWYKAARWLTGHNLQKLYIAQNFSYQAFGLIGDESRIDFSANFPLFFAYHSLSFTPKALQFQELLGLQAALGKELLQLQDYKTTVNYWQTDSEQSRRFPLPDDLDDTAALGSALLVNELKLAPKFFLAAIQLESKPGGPYTSWFIAENTPQIAKWQDIDLAVNANFLYTAALAGLELPSVVTYLEKSLSQSQFRSSYYPDRLLVVYYVSRFLRTPAGLECRQLRQKILGVLSNYNYAELDLINQLYYCLSLLHSGQQMQGRFAAKLLLPILTAQLPAGQFPLQAICKDFPRPDGIETFTGSEVSTTSLALELFALYLKTAEPKGAIMTQKLLLVNTDLDLIWQGIAKELDAQQIEVPVYLRFKTRTDSKVFRLLELLVQVANHKFEPATDTEIFSNYCKALYYEWLAYTILDATLDTKQSTGDLISAFGLHRLSWQYIAQTSKILPEFADLCQQSALIAESVYRFELKQLRPAELNKSQKSPETLNTDYQYIHTRSSAVTSLLAQIFYILKPSKIPEFAAQADLLQLFLNNVFFIDQLNDDAHDWQEDQAAGNLNYVLKLLQTLDYNPDTQVKTFWLTVIPQVSALADKAYVEAQQALVTLDLGHAELTGLLEASIDPIRKAAAERAAILQLFDYVKIS